MRATIVVSDPRHPIRAHLSGWLEQQRAADVMLVSRLAEADGGDFLFLVSCTEIVNQDIKARYRHTLVLHASELPAGRGWSPHVWAILAGARELCMTLLEAAEKLDAGRIWAQRRIPLAGHELHDEINAVLFKAETDLIEYALTSEADIVPQEQAQGEEPHLRRRLPEDSRIDPERSIAEQFDLLRVCDPDRFPAFFDLRGCRYKVILEKI